jgi:hypothetical protein
MKQAPKYLHPKAILWATSYENMSNEDRHKVFQAYKYEEKQKKYILEKPELLNGSIIDKISAWDD